MIIFASLFTCATARIPECACVCLGRGGEVERERETDRQTDRQTNRQRQTDRQKERDYYILQNSNDKASTSLADGGKVRGLC